MKRDTSYEQGYQDGIQTVVRDLGSKFPRLAEVIHDVYLRRDADCADIGGPERETVSPSFALAKTRKLTA